MRRAFQWLVRMMVLMPLIILTAQAATCTWKGVSGDWHTAANWTNGVPSVGDTAIINNGSVLLTNQTAALSSLTLNGGSLTFTNWTTKLTATTVTLNGGTVSAEGPYIDGVMSNRVWVSCADMFLANGATISLDGKGFAGADAGATATNGYGPGKGLWATSYAGGGGHGGIGAHVRANVALGGASYDSASAPMSPGSGGGVWYDSGTAGAGGGAVRIDATGTVAINGSISANGVTGLYPSGGGGSGGAVYISCQTFAGTNGNVSADGGGGPRYGTGGGGGRIAVVYTSVSTPKPTVICSTRGGSSTDGIGDLGTLYFPDASIMDGAWFPHSGRLVIPGFSAWSLDSLIVSNGWLRFPHGGFTLTVTNDLTVIGSSAKLEIGGTDFAALQTNYYSDTTSPPRVNVGGSLLVTNGAMLCVYAAETNASTAEYGALVSVTGDTVIATNASICPYSDCVNGGSVFFMTKNLTVASGGVFDADEKGYGGRFYVAGEGFGPGRGSGSSGAGYGGAGGDGTHTPLPPGGVSYGLSNAPAMPGSGGGSQGFGSHVGGIGGGLVWVTATHAVTVDGTISANGGDAVDTAAGGGSGGGTFIRCSTFSGAGGTMTVNGGDGGATYGGGGGGGRIAVWYGSIFDSDSQKILSGQEDQVSCLSIMNSHEDFSGTLQSIAGGGQNSGQSGTIVFLTVLPPSGTVVQIH